MSTILYSVTSHNTVIFIVSAVRSSTIARKFLSTVKYEYNPLILFN